MHPDTVLFHPSIYKDEIKQYLDAHYINSHEAFWHSLASEERVG
jgi:hypothetical protein